MFIRVKNMQTDAELNVNTNQIVSFEPANDGANSKISLVNGTSYVVDVSNRTLRHKVKKADTAADTSTE